MIRRGALHGLLEKVEAQRFNQMELHAGRYAGSYDISRILRNLRLIQDDMLQAFPILRSFCYLLLLSYGIPSAFGRVDFLEVKIRDDHRHDLRGSIM
jgi:hypothetical protein